MAIALTRHRTTGERDADDTGKGPVDVGSMFEFWVFGLYRLKLTRNDVGSEVDVTCYWVGK